MYGKRACKLPGKGLRVLTQTWAAKHAYHLEARGWLFVHAAERGRARAWASPPVPAELHSLQSHLVSQDWSQGLRVRDSGLRLQGDLQLPSRTQISLVWLWTYLLWPNLQKSYRSLTPTDLEKIRCLHDFVYQNCLLQFFCKINRILHLLFTFQSGFVKMQGIYPEDLFLNQWGHGLSWDSHHRVIIALCQDAELSHTVFCSSTVKCQSLQLKYGQTSNLSTQWFSVVQDNSQRLM